MRFTHLVSRSLRPCPCVVLGLSVPSNSPRVSRAHRNQPHSAGSALPRSETPSFFLKRSAPNLHYWDEWKKSRGARRLGCPLRSRHGRPLATGGKQWVFRSPEPQWGKRLRRSSGYLLRGIFAVNFCPYPARRTNPGSLHKALPCFLASRIAQTVQERSRPQLAGSANCASFDEGLRRGS
jgi:hypothetical protein